MRDLIITLVQADQIWEDVEANLNHYNSLLANLGSTDLILLPEMFQTAFSMNTSLAETMDGPSILWLKQLASEKDAAVYTSLMIAEGGNYYNRGVFVRPSGEISTYDKRKTFSLAKENEHFASGTTEQVVTWRGWNIQLQICYDLRFPEIVRNRIDENGNPVYDLILYVANWPEKRSSHWNALLNARAIENQSYVVGVNRVGEDGKGFTYTGNSQMVDALGNNRVLPIGVESVETIVIKKHDLKRIHEMLPFLCDR